MGLWHISPSCETALVRLNDELCEFERQTGREYTLILVPHSPDEEIHLSQSGKPLPEGFTPEEVLGIALAKRGNS